MIRHINSFIFTQTWIVRDNLQCWKKSRVTIARQSFVVCGGQTKSKSFWNCAKGSHMWVQIFVFVGFIAAGEECTNGRRWFLKPIPTHGHHGIWFGYDEMKQTQWVGSVTLETHAYSAQTQIAPFHRETLRLSHRTIYFNIHLPVAMCLLNRSITLSLVIVFTTTLL